MKAAIRGAARLPLPKERDLPSASPWNADTLKREQRAQDGLNAAWKMC